MSERVLVAAAGVVVLFGAAYAFRDDMPDRVRWVMFGKPSPPPPIWRGPVAVLTPPPAPTPHPELAPARSPRVIRTSGRSEARQPQPQPRPVPVYDIAVEVPPAPVASDIRPNMSITEVISKYGAPDAAAEWSNGGSLIQKLIYKSGSKALEVDVRNGSVVAARTQEP